MMQLLKIGAVNLAPGQFVPRCMESLAAASPHHGEDLLPHVHRTFAVSASRRSSTASLPPSIPTAWD